MSMSGEIDRDDVLDLGLDEKVTESRAATDVRSTIRFDDPNLDEREKVIAALEQSGWVQAKAARLLGMTPRQIAYRIQTLNIKVKQF
jgi:Nif-specific regulatory protein